MIFLILIAVIAAGIWIMEKTYWDEIVGIMMSLFGTILLLTCLLLFVVRTVGAEGQKQAKLQEYAALTYQLENDLYENDNDIGKKALMNQITSWNKDLAFHKAVQRDIWIGVFIPNIYDDLQFIDLG